MTDDLVGRLRKRASQYGMLLSDPPKPTAENALLAEAAARIEALEAENAALREAAAELINEKSMVQSALEQVQQMLTPPGNVWTGNEPQEQAQAVMLINAVMEPPHAD